MIYNATNWYWIVAGTSHVWSSTSLGYVSPSNAVYQRWLGAGHHPTRIGNATDLLQVMLAAVRPHVMQKGIVVASASMPSLNGTYALDDASLTTMSNLALGLAAGRPLPGGGETFNFSDAAGGPHSFTAPQFIAFVNACEGYVYHWTQALTNKLHSKAASYPSNIVSIA